MKRILAALFIISSMVLFSDDATDAQPNPVFSKNSVVAKKVMSLLRAKAVFVVEPSGNNKGGVVVLPGRIINEDRFIEESKNEEMFFVSGVNLDKITEGCMVYHHSDGFGSGYTLDVWRIGTISIPRDGKTLRLKKFTVDPKEAMAYLGK